MSQIRFSPSEWQTAGGAYGQAGHCVGAMSSHRSAWPTRRPNQAIGAALAKLLN